MEAAIRMHKSKDHGQKLSDGKTIDRKGRLTDNIVDSIPTYCGQTISSNICNLKTIQGDVLAINYHIIDGLSEESLELTTLFVLLVRSHGLSLSLIKQMLQIFIISISFTFHSELKHIFQTLSSDTPIHITTWQRIRTSHSTALYGLSVQSEFSVVYMD